MVRHRRGDAHRRLVFGDRNRDVARMELLLRPAKARRRPVDVVTDNRPTALSAVDSKLMGSAGHWCKRKPSKLRFRSPAFGGGRFRPSRRDSLPPWGGGWGGGSGGRFNEVLSLPPPIADHSPQGGGEAYRPNTFHVVTEGSPRGS